MVAWHQWWTHESKYQHRTLCAFKCERECEPMHVGVVLPAAEDIYFQSEVNRSNPQRLQESSTSPLSSLHNPRTFWFLRQRVSKCTQTLQPISYSILSKPPFSLHFYPLTCQSSSYSRFIYFNLLSHSFRSVNFFPRCSNLQLSVSSFSRYFPLSQLHPSVTFSPPIWL